MILNANESTVEWEERATARLQQCQRQREQEGRRSERTEIRQARLNRQRVHGEESSVVLNRSIGVERDPSCQLALNINKLMLHVNLHWTLTSWCYVHHSSVTPISACSGLPPQCSHFLVMLSWLVYNLSNVLTLADVRCTVVSTRKMANWMMCCMVGRVGHCSSEVHTVSWQYWHKHTLK